MMLMDDDYTPPALNGSTRDKIRTKGNIGKTGVATPHKLSAAFSKKGGGGKSILSDKVKPMPGKQATAKRMAK